MKTKYYFPLLKKVILRNISIYDRNPIIEFDIGKNITCLTGANGLGKSTFINLINYALTGIVKSPKTNFRHYNSIEKFYNDNKNFASSYFKGRIAEKDRNIAEIEIHFEVKNVHFKIIRKIFEVDQLKFLEIKVNNKAEGYSEFSPAQKNTEYNKVLTKEIGLSRFEQYVFLQMFILTFDESHKLLFWDKRLLQSAIYSFFGISSDDAFEVDELIKKRDGLDSDIRNYQYQISLQRTLLKNATADIDNLKLDKEKKSYVEYEELYDDYQIKENERDVLIDELKNTEESISKNVILQYELKDEFDNKFASMFNEEIIEKDVYIINLIKKLKIKIYENLPYDDIINDLIKHLKNDVKNKQDDKLFDDIKSIDVKLQEIQQNLIDLKKQKERLSDEIKESETLLNITKDKIDDLLESNNVLKYANLRNSKTPEIILQQYKNTIDSYNELKDKAYREREEYNDKIKYYGEILDRNYMKLQKEFIGTFNKYAKQFLGININVNLIKATKGVYLALDINDNERNEEYQLSESQRYFVDIALRMALIRLNSSSCFMLIDTPEGSLDIAYESRAGEMFAEFSHDNFNIFMTANINSSEMLLRLAEKCRREGMQLVSMILWTTLTEVQTAEYEKIDFAMKEIEKKLNDRY